MGMAHGHCRSYIRSIIKIIKNKDETERIDTSETEPLFTISVENKALNNPNNEISFDQVWFA